MFLCWDWWTIKVKVCGATDWCFSFLIRLPLVCKLFQESVLISYFWKQKGSSNILHRWSGKWKQKLKLMHYSAVKNALRQRKKRTRLCLIFSTLVAAPCLHSLHVSCVWKGSKQHEARAIMSSRVTWLFSSLHATIMVGQGVKGNTVAKHAGIHGL